MKTILIKNKKGNILGDETVQFLITLICIGFLIYLLYSIYLTVSVSDKTIQADSILNGVIDPAIKSGQFPAEIDMPAPIDWFLMGFTGEKKPNSCLGKKCLCICEKIGNFRMSIDPSSQIKKCDKGGVCLVISNLEKNVEIKIERGSVNTIIINQVKGAISVTRK